MFESRVILDGSQTVSMTFCMAALFESRVILDGSQTAPLPNKEQRSLRVVLF